MFSKKTKALVVFCLVIAFLLHRGVGWAQTGPLKLSLASFTQGSGWHVMAQTMVKLVKTALPAGSQVDALPYSGGVANPMLLDQGKADLALGFPMETGLALRGEPPYKKKIPDLRLLVGNLDTYWYVFSVREGLPITSFQDIKAKKYPLRLVVMPVGSSGEWATSRLLASYGITYNDIVAWGGKVSYVSFPTAVEMMQDGQADAFGNQCTPGHSSWMQLTNSIKVRFLPIDKAVAQDLESKYGFRPGNFPKGIFPGVDRDIPVLSFATCLITTTRLSDDLAYKITKAICTNKEVLALAYEGSKTFDPNKAAQVSLPLHPGAEKYYRETGIIK
jgi:TRAP transporter TAXI family solute receptor